MRGLVLKDLDLLADFAEKGVPFEVSEVVPGSPQARVLEALTSAREVAERLSRKDLFVHYLDTVTRLTGKFSPSQALEFFLHLRQRGLLKKPAHLSIVRRYQNLKTVANKVDVLKHVAVGKEWDIDAGKAWRPSEPVQAVLSRQAAASTEAATAYAIASLRVAEEIMAGFLGVSPDRLRVAEPKQMLVILAEREQQLMAMVRNPRAAAVASRRRMAEVLRNPEKHGLRGREANILFRYQLEDLKWQGHLPYELEAAKYIQSVEHARKLRRVNARARQLLRKRSRARSRAK